MPDVELPPHLELLVKLLNMLSSNHDGEVTNAARAAHRVIHDAGESWLSLAIAADSSQAGQRRLIAIQWENENLRRENLRLRAQLKRANQQTKSPIPEDHVSKVIHMLRAKSHLLSDVENYFIETISLNLQLTDEQRHQLAALARRVLI
jgi:hypothetical protein